MQRPCSALDPNGKGDASGTARGEASRRRTRSNMASSPSPKSLQSKGSHRMKERTSRLTYKVAADRWADSQCRREGARVAVE